MKNLILAFCLILLPLTAVAKNTPSDWGQNGHRSTAQIAQQYLKKNTLKRVQEILKGESLAVASTFSDEIKSDRAFRKYNAWHYINIDEDASIAQINNLKEENIVWAIEKCVEVLKDSKRSEQEQEFHLKMLIHLVGDLHQPMHVGRAEDRGGNDIDVIWFGKPSNLHRVWDSEMIASYDMSFTELAEHRPSLNKNQIMSLQEGTPAEWALESQKIATKLYADAAKNYNLRYSYMYEWFPVLKAQLEKGGLRLAKVLNEIYG
jgi:hypothetical protein